MTGTDLSLLAAEMEKAQEVLAKIKEMKTGVIGDKRIVVHTQVLMHSLLFIPIIVDAIHRN